ncbi:Dimodular nonribosomal peptide synthase [Nonomuraea coxensis DSM 45129]|uniref:Dimodular nonribosomal peptide synthase n=1 Tax=Nonomuraea coxensis DSM 45129 TaxID=1122611 RepID=A0ABX8U1I4_9ACTN|nr:non-ribosomal peptide synthetase [Nonomuraea coxensis]QYC41605.1 Dimodular nonribosomal peptide synthase [Nonomuraea coxensis DSM 45129]
MTVAAPEARLSYAQERLWLHHQADPESAAYNVCLALRLRGPLDAAALAAALGGVVARHEPLRTLYTAHDGRPAATVLPPSPVELPVWPAGGEREAAALAAAAAREPFDLARGPVLRAALARLSAADHVLLLTVHHIAVDEWSLKVLLAELDALYRAALAGAPDPLPPLPASYAEVVAAERAADLSAARRYWHAALAGLPALDLPADVPATADPGLEEDLAGEVVRFTVPPALAAALGAVARRARVTPYMAGLAAFTAFLARHCGQDDVAVGTTVANRAVPGAEHLVGAFFNTVVLRGDVSGRPTFAELLARTRARCLDALTHQHLPYSMLGGTGRAPLFRVLFEMHAGVPARTRLGDLEAEPFDFPDTAAKYDLALSLVPAGDRLEGHLTYRTALFGPDTARGLAESFLHLLEGLAAEPDRPVGDLELLPPGRRAAVLAASRGPAPLGPLALRAHDLFEEQARRTPQATAVVSGRVRLSYRELDERANRIAHWLRERGAGPERVVGVRMERSDWLVAALLGVWKAGAAYLPLDPGLPAERLAHMVADSGALLVVDDAAELARAVAGRPAGPPRDAGSGPGHLAYVIYTSGSTGRPKGVLVQHRGLVNFLRWCVAAYAAGGVGGAPLFSSVAYDMVVPNLFTPLVTGQAVHVLPHAATLDELGEELSGRPYGFVKLTPGHLEVLAGQLDPEAAAGLAGVLVVGADAFPSRALAFWQALDPPPVLLNEYGPTEATVANCVHTVRGPVAGELVPIGRPIPGTTMYVLDEAMRPLPAGVPGELYIGGECVARGYHGRPALTAERFVPDPYGEPGARLYRTGDRGRLRPDGEFEFLGRLDDQVKIRGHRVEPGEVSAALDEVPGVSGSVVVAAPAPGGGSRLVAYVVGTAGTGEIRAALARRLPGHMIPAQYVPLPRIPLNRNGKVDRSALPPPPAAPSPEAGRAPRTGVERQLADLVAGVLGAALDDLDLDQDLFGRGIDSLGAVRLVAKVEERLGVKIKLRRFLADATIGGLARLVSSALPDAADVLDRMNADQEVRRADAPRDAEGDDAAGPVVVRLGGGGPLPADPSPVYCVHPLGGSAHCYGALAGLLAGRRAVHGLQALESGLSPASLPELAARYAAEIAAAGPGPVTLLGWSAGGVLAFETARELTGLGHPPRRVVLVDSVLPDALTLELLDDLTELEDLIDRVGALGPEPAGRLLEESDLGVFDGLGLTPGQAAAYYRAYGPALLRLWRDGLRGLADYRPRRYAGPVTLLAGDRNPRRVRDAQLAGWRRAAADLDVHEIRGEHHDLLRLPAAAQIVPFLDR